MKKSKTVRILCMALALLLVSQFAVTAFAATSSTWPDNGDTCFMETTWINSSSSRSNAAISTTTISHTRWYTTYMDGYYDMASDERWQDMEYGNTVISTAAMDNYDQYYQENNLYLQDAVGGIPDTAQSGNYYVRADTACHLINYTVYRNDIAEYVNAVYAPYDIYEAATGYRKS